MNVKKTIFTVFTITITVLFLLQGRVFFESRRAIEQYRNREQEYTRAIEDCRNQINEYRRVVSEVSTELGEGTESLQRQYSSIQELRTLLRKIEQNYENMENIINSLSISTDDSNSGGGA